MLWGVARYPDATAPTYGFIKRIFKINHQRSFLVAVRYVLRVSGLYLVQFSHIISVNNEFPVCLINLLGKEHSSGVLKTC